jgi:hypothetical protein
VYGGQTLGQKYLVYFGIADIFDKQMYRNGGCKMALFTLAQYFQAANCSSMFQILEAIIPCFLILRYNCEYNREHE